MPREQRVIGGTAVATTEIEHSIPTKEHCSTIVIGIRIIHREENALTIRLGNLGFLINGPTRENIHALVVFVHRGVIGEEEVVLGKVWVEHHRQETFFIAAAIDLLAHIKKYWRFLRFTISRIDHQDAPRLLHHIHALIAGRLKDHLDRTAQHHFGCNALQFEFWHRCGLGNLGCFSWQLHCGCSRCRRRE